MFALKSKFDGESIGVPEQLRGMPPVEVIILVAEMGEEMPANELLKAQEDASD